MIKYLYFSKQSFNFNLAFCKQSCSYLCNVPICLTFITFFSSRFILVLLIFLFANTAVARHLLEPADTTSPRSTIESFITITEEAGNRFTAYRSSPSPATQKALAKTMAKGWRLLDLSQVPPAASYEVGAHTFILLWEIMARLDLPVLEEIPDRSVYAQDDNKQQLAYWRIPHTEITIKRVDEGLRKGEFLFSPDTVNRVQAFYETIQHQPYLRPVPIDNLFRSQQLYTGWMIPMIWVEAFPDWMNQPMHGQVLWKWFALFILAVISLLLGITLFHWSHRKPWDCSFNSYLRFMSIPIILFFLIPFLRYIIRDQINVTGDAAELPGYILEIAFGVAVVWSVWLTSKWITDAIIDLPHIKDDSLDAHLLRLVARSVGILAVIFFMFHLANSMGVPVYGLVAGAGVGGIGIALAAKNTLENFMGTLNLYADHPVGIGDLCHYDEESTSGWHPVGRIEEIGLRSTKIRRLDRTLITIPNADFAKRHIVNMETCDRFLLNTTLGIRYETTDEQLRFLLVELRKLMHAHPKTIHTVDDPVRVRFCEFGDYSLNVCIRVYIRTTDYNEFLAIQEDILLRMMNVVKKAGTSIAFPSKTLYYARDKGLDNEQQEAAEKKVKEWAVAQTLAFPDFEEHYRQKISDTLDYPPKGTHGSE